MTSDSNEASSLLKDLIEQAKDRNLETIYAGLIKLKAICKVMEDIKASVPPVSVDFASFVTETVHRPRNLMVFVESSAFSNAGRTLEHDALKQLFETGAQRIVGLKTGVNLKLRLESPGAHEVEMRPYLENGTERVRFDFREKYGRHIEALLRAHMEAYCQNPDQGGIDMVFVEPDAAGTFPVAVWRSYVTIQSSGESEAYRDFGLTPPDEVICEIPCQGTFHYNRPTDMAHAQKLLDELRTSSPSLDLEVADKLANATLPTTQLPHRGMAQLAAAAAAVGSVVVADRERQEIRIDVISHKDCLDGMASAWVVQEYYRLENCKENTPVHFDVHVHFTDYHLPLPEVPEKSNIFMVDFCPNDVGVVKNVLCRCSSLTIIDHHPKTEAVIEELKDWVIAEGIVDRFDAEFSTHKSGALLTWDYLESSPAPAAIQAVSDRDLWKFELPDTKPLCEALMTYGMTMSGFSGCMDDQSPEGIQELINRGHVIGHAKDAQIDWLIKNTLCELEGYAMIDGEAQGYRLLAVNGSKPLASQACEELEKRFPEYPAYVCYWDIENGTKRRYSIRASRGTLPRNLARYYGGNGHDSAAGFSLPIEATLRVIRNVSK